MSVLKEKLEYIITSSLPDDVEIKDFYVDPDWSYSRYFVFIKFDITEPIYTIDELNTSVKKIEENVRESLSSYLFDKDGKYINKIDKNLTVSIDSDLNSLSFQADDYCLVNLGFIVYWQQN